MQGSLPMGREEGKRSLVRILKRLTSEAMFLIRIEVMLALEMLHLAELH